MKVCSKCKKEKDDEKFYLKKKGGTKRQAECKDCRDLAAARLRKSVKELVFSHYGRFCSCCGETEIMFLTIDHINNNGAEHRRKSGRDIHRAIIKEDFPDDLQVLCFNCNCGRHFNGGICPHKDWNVFNG